MLHYLNTAVNECIILTIRRDPLDHFEMIVIMRLEFFFKIAVLPVYPLGSGS